eukprot:TRINITY_DN9001_c0_g1_i1.p1 TRINITY_DN9001_c0_g1~~TRINITY_DN9001_c0_g1_i1.p1  ORF type:complete len:154 (+),score=34.44 TRINITY_DN9001_c0_g1_i1:42-503(+)
MEAGPTSPDSNAEKRFSTNSYHYWHNHEKDKAAAGDVAPKATPQLVGTSVEAVVKPTRNITKYSFADGKKAVKVYVDLPGVGAAPDTVRVEFGEASFDMRVRGEAEDQRLCIPELKEAILPTDSSFVVKPDSVVISLVKKELTSWFELKKSKP